MTETRSAKLRSTAHRILTNPHFWVVLVLSALLLVIYEAWPWRHWQFTQGFWSFFPWLANMDFIVVDVELRFHVLGVLFFVPIIYGSLTLGWPGGLFAWLLSLIWLLPMHMAWGGRWEFNNLMLLLLPVLVVAVAQGERRWREGEKRNFAERQREGQAFVAKLVETQEAERRRIALEIHDETLQTLMVIASKCDSLASSCTDDEQSAGNLWVKQKVLQSMDDLRRLSMNLRPSILDNFGLVSGIRWLVNHSNTQGSCCIDTRVVGEERKMSSLVEVTIFRVVQEALHNIQRHSQAKHGDVLLNFEDDRLTLEVQDDGIGFHLPERLVLYVAQGSLGIIGMEQRILSVGGTMHLDSHLGRGTRLRATIPCAASDYVVQGKNA